jgi:hypothetical protein
VIVLQWAGAAVYVLGLCHRKALAHVVPTPCHAASVSPSVVIMPRLDLCLDCLLLPAGLPSQAHGSPHRSTVATRHSHITGCGIVVPLSGMPAD